MYNHEVFLPRRHNKMFVDNIFFCMQITGITPYFALLARALHSRIMLPAKLWMEFRMTNIQCRTPWMVIIIHGGKWS